MATTRRTRGGRRGADTDQDSSRKGSRKGSAKAGKGDKAGKGGRGRGGRDDKGAKNSSKRGAAADDQGSRRGGRARKQSNPVVGYIVWGSIIVLVTAGIILAVSWHAIQRSMILGQLDQEEITFADERPIMDEFLAYMATNENPDRGTHVSTTIVSKRGSVDAQIYLGIRAARPGDLMRIANRSTSEVSHLQRAQALLACVALLEPEGPVSPAKLKVGDTGVTIDDNYLDLLQKMNRSAMLDDLPVIPSKLSDWCLQEDWETTERDLAIAAVRFVGARGEEMAGSDPAKLFKDMIRDPATDPTLVDACIDSLAQVTNRNNVGFALALLTSPNGDKILNHDRPIKNLGGRRGPIMLQIEKSVQPNVLDRLLELLDHENPVVQASAVSLLKGDGLRAIDNAQQDLVGKRIAAYLSEEVRSEKPQVFSEALASARALKLHGAREALYDLLPVIDAAHPDAEVIATALGGMFIDKDPDAEARSEDIISHLAVAIETGEGRTTAARAVKAITVGGFINLRRALEACVTNANDADCFAAAKHVVGKLYGAADTVSKLGDDVARWQAFIAEDKPRFDHFYEVYEWYEANKHKITVQTPSEELRANMQRCTKEIELFDTWDAPPLGIENHMFEKFVANIRMFRKASQNSIH